MRVLVSVASKHGATAEIAERIGQEVSHGLPGARVDVRAAAEVHDISDYDAVIVGSGVYAGHWLRPAKDVVEACSRRPDVPVWLFSSGPVGDPPKPDGEPEDVAALVAKSGAREHVVLGGKIEKSALSMGERAVVSMVRAPYGDYRDWQRVGDFARAVVAQLRPEVPA